MKKYTVESSYKNPDKFIDKLKVDAYNFGVYKNHLENRIVELNKEIKELQILAQNELWFKYQEPGAKLSVSINDYSATRKLAELDIASPIYCIGEVTKISRSKDKNSANFMIKSVYTKKEN